MNKIEFTRNHSNQLTVSFSKLARIKYWWLKRLIVHKYALKPVGRKMKTLDAVWREFELDNKKLTIDWDSWSGFSVTARNVDAEPLIKEIGDFLTQRYS